MHDKKIRFAKGDLTVNNKCCIARERSSIRRRHSRHRRRCNPRRHRHDRRHSCHHRSRLQSAKNSIIKILPQKKANKKKLTYDEVSTLTESLILKLPGVYLKNGDLDRDPSVQIILFSPNPDHQQKTTGSEKFGSGSMKKRPLFDTLNTVLFWPCYFKTYSKNIIYVDIRSLLKDFNKAKNKPIRV